MGVETWFARCIHYASIQTQVPFNFFFFLAPTRWRDPGFYLPILKDSPSLGPTNEDLLTGFQAGMGWLKKNSSDPGDPWRPWGPLGQAWVIIW